MSSGLDVSPAFVSLTRRAKIPDRYRLARARRAPELGPHLLFLSGGTALKNTSIELIRYTHNSTHLITPFDSGGSSAVIRKAFPIISVGDLRNRLMAMVDRTERGHPELIRLFGYRFEKGDDVTQSQLVARIRKMVEGKDPLVAAVPLPLRTLVCTYLRCFAQHMPSTFDLRGASIGNLVLVGGYLNHDQDMDAVLFLFSRLVEVRGLVRPIINENLHLVADLADGSVLCGQHRITDPQRKGAAITGVRMSSKQDEDCPVQASIDERTQALIAKAELICYPVGSFFSSVSACLLPSGVGANIAQAGCPKIYVPNCGRDCEAPDLSPAEATEKLLASLRADAGPERKTEDLLNYVVVDRKQGVYPGGVDEARIRACGAEILDLPLVSADSSPLICPERLVETLMSMV